MILLFIILGYIIYSNAYNYFDDQAKKREQTVKVDYNTWKDGTNG